MIFFVFSFLEEIKNKLKNDYNDYDDEKYTHIWQWIRKKVSYKQIT